jgi:fructose-bisphosphate aldolase class II
MLVNLREITAIAEQNNMAIGAFNVPSFEGVRAAINAAEKTGYPVIIQHAEAHEDIAPLEMMGPAMVALAKRSNTLVCVHLDHCVDLSYMRRALEMGFTGAMYDGSMLPYDQNIENSKRAALMCHEFNCGLECELGSMGASENGQGDEANAIYTNPQQAKDFVKQSGLDIMAVSFGTVHGLYKGEPHLSFDVLNKIRDQVKIPLVMHGGSGVSDDDYHKAINAGIRKINYYTYGAKFAGEAVRKYVKKQTAADKDAIVYWHEMTVTAYNELFKTFEHVIKTFANGAAPLA